MSNNIIHDRGRGPEIVGTRITIYNLLPYFLDPTTTEADICQLNRLRPEQVAAARAYVLNHADAVLAEHLKIEARIAGGNSPQAVEQAKKTRETFKAFREWLTHRNLAAAGPQNGDNDHDDRLNKLSEFRNWLAGREAHVGERT